MWADVDLLQQLNYTSLERCDVVVGLFEVLDYVLPDQVELAAQTPNQALLNLGFEIIQKVVCYVRLQP